MSFKAKGSYNTYTHIFRERYCVKLWYLFHFMSLHFSPLNIVTVNQHYVWFVADFVYTWKAIKQQSFILTFPGLPCIIWKYVHTSLSILGEQYKNTVGVSRWSQGLGHICCRGREAIWNSQSRCILQPKNTNFCGQFSYILQPDFEILHTFNLSFRELPCFAPVPPTRVE